MSRSLNSFTYQELRRLLIEARKAAGLTQVEVAKRLNRQQNFMSKWENAQHHLDVVEFIELCAAIGISAADVVMTLERRTISSDPSLFR